MPRYIDYQSRQHASSALIAIAYASHFARSAVMKKQDAAVESIKSGDVGFGAKLAELHNASSGLKFWTSYKAGAGIEVCRRLCGGHNFSQRVGSCNLVTKSLGHLVVRLQEPTHSNERRTYSASNIKLGIFSRSWIC